MSYHLIEGQSENEQERPCESYTCSDCPESQCYRREGYCITSKNPNAPPPSEPCPPSSPEPKESWPPSKTAQLSMPTNFNIHHNREHIELFSLS